MTFVDLLYNTDNTNSITTYNMYYTAINFSSISFNYSIVFFHTKTRNTAALSIKN